MPVGTIPSILTLWLKNSKDDLVEKLSCLTGAANMKGRSLVLTYSNCNLFYAHAQKHKQSGCTYVSRFSWNFGTSFWWVNISSDRRQNLNQSLSALICLCIILLRQNQTFFLSVNHKKLLNFLWKLHYFFVNYRWMLKFDQLWVFWHGRT